MREEGTVTKTVSLPISRVVEIEKFAERSERTFSGAASYLLKMGLVYVNQVLPDQEAHINAQVEARIAAERRKGG